MAEEEACTRSGSIPASDAFSVKVKIRAKRASKTNQGEGEGIYRKNKIG